MTKKRSDPRRGHAKARIIDYIKSWGFLGPSFIGVLIFFIIPFGVTVYYAFIDSTVTKNFVGLGNFVKLFGNNAFKTAALNSLTLSFTAVPLAVILGMLLAMLLEAKIPYKSNFRTFFLSPMMVPIASIVLIWQVLFSYNGSVNEIIMFFGGDKIDFLQSKYAQLVVILLYLWKNLGYNMILFMAAFANVPKAGIEAAQVDGANDRYIFFNIKLRYISPTILFVTILSFINSFKVFREVYLLSGAYPFETLYTLQHFMNNTFQSLDYQKLSAAAVIMAVFMSIIIALLFKLEDVFGKDVEG